MTYRSASTIRADAARRVYDATGRGIVVAVIDSGVDATHVHFQRHRNLELPEGLSHVDFMSDSEDPASALVDEFGHGTHIAGIIAGEATAVRVAEKSWRDDGESEHEAVSVPLIAGIAPECKILSMKVLEETGNGHISTVIRALERVQQLNEGRLRIPIVNMGLGYEYDAARFACGRSPICVAVERLVRSGVVVVTSSGNTGYGQQAAMQRPTLQGMEVSINDPGNAELAITVGSTDRELPQVYGVSYFSSKGPTLDGRLKPDLVAPGERIVSCGTGGALARLREKGVPEDVMYLADSGTSIAAAHVAGAAAALLSARRELIGQPEALKAVLMNSAVDLRRSPSFQGRGIVDLLQAMQENALRVGATTEMGTSAGARGRAVEPMRPATPAMPPARAESTPRPLRVMYSYSHKDDDLREELDVALAALRREGLIQVWQDRDEICREASSTRTSCAHSRMPTSFSCWCQEGTSTPITLGARKWRKRSDVTTKARASWYRSSSGPSTGRRLPSQSSTRCRATGSR